MFNSKGEEDCRFRPQSREAQRIPAPPANDIEVQRTDRFEIEAVPMGEDSRPGRKGGVRILLVEAPQEDADGAL